MSLILYTILFNSSALILYALAASISFTKNPKCNCLLLYTKRALNLLVFLFKITPKYLLDLFCIILILFSV